MRRGAVLMATIMVTWMIAGCGGLAGLPVPASDNLTAGTGEKAEAVAHEIGGNGGYGGTLMNGYYNHAPMHMGFVDASALAGDGDVITVRLVNDTPYDCTFELGYFASYMGLSENIDTIDVPANGEFEVDVPCAEILGLGDLEMPGSPGCFLSDGEAVSNIMAVPGFLGLDYACGGTYTFHMTPDTDDLDGDGDVEELVLVSEAMQNHMGLGGPMGHHHQVGGSFGGHHHGFFPQ